MSRPTLALAMIVKNEAHNLPILLKSVEGCFDEIHITDTGSTDDTVRIASEHGCHVKHFDWVHDFALARNFSFKDITTDYIMWMDGDDVLENKEAFVKWRDHAMRHGEYWLNKYAYAHDESGNSLCEFTRERVIKNGLGLKWNYFVHEGIPPESLHALRKQVATTWWVKHRRSLQDQVADKSRNLKIFEKHKSNLDSRMTFYYGKEFFENGKHLEAYEWLKKALEKPDLMLHDRILGHQYLCYSLLELGQNEQARNMASLGLQLDAHRAEFYVVIGDAYLKQNNPKDALPSFMAAKSCLGLLPGSVHSQALFSHPAAYTTYPRIQASKILASLAKFEEAIYEAKECFRLYENKEAKELLEELERIKSITMDKIQTAKECDDIVIVCPPQGAYPWNEKLYLEKGMGGSETAAIEMAKWLKKLTTRKVIVFNNTEEEFTSESGVEYRKASGVPHYMSENKPKVCINWRHNIRVTNAKTYAWCHDLMMPSAEITQNFDQMLCLSPFHKNYLSALQGVPESKITLTRNGIDPAKFNFERPKKDENKLIWVSSPDRGLDRCMLILDQVRKEFPDVKLHVYYGLENLDKYGMKDLADKLRKMMSERDWVIYHGFTEQKKMAREIADAVIWPHACDFIETFCISAIEALCLGIYPVTRRLGALQDTLKEAELKGMASLLDVDPTEAEGLAPYAEEIVKTLRERRWTKVHVNPKDYAWEGVAKEWIRMMEL